jgi:predicted alpha/beta-fold hydrolase
LTLKYIGDLGAAIDQRICGAVGVSVPCDLATSAKQLERWGNRIYMARFMRTLREKVREKAARFPGVLDLEDLDAILTFAEFDDRYTGPIHGFEGANDYWMQSSCLPVLGKIKVPTLLINAQDDPFLTLKCFPHEAALANPCLNLETPKHGGHLGFVSFSDEGFYWSEQRAAVFLKNAQEKLDST